MKVAKMKKYNMYNVQYNVYNNSVYVINNATYLSFMYFACRKRTSTKGAERARASTNAHAPQGEVRMRLRGRCARASGGGAHARIPSTTTRNVSDPASMSIKVKSHYD